MIENNIEKLAFTWLKEEPNKIDKSSKYFCETRDIFQARLDSMTTDLINNNLAENYIYLLSAITGEIGNNSFDHNLGNWPNTAGIFFAYLFQNNNLKIILADRGQGILKTLKKIKPELKNDQEALKTAFYEKISGRSPENRGNGLKFVRRSILNNKIHLNFYSGNARAELNNKFEINLQAESISGCLAILTINL